MNCGRGRSPHQASALVLPQQLGERYGDTVGALDSEPERLEARGRATQGDMG